MRNSTDPKQQAARETETFWETIAHSRWGRYITAIECRSIVRAHEMGGEPSIALEIGCEGGRWSALLSNLGWKTICTEIDPETLALCQQRLPSAKCILVRPDDRTLPCEDQAIGMLICIEVFEVVHAGWFLEEMRRVIRPGGFFVGVVTNSNSLRKFGHHIRNLIEARKPDPTSYHHAYNISYHHWREELIRKNFEIVSQEGLCWFPFSRESNSFLIPPLVKLEKTMGFRAVPTLSPWISVVARKKLG